MVKLDTKYGTFFKLEKGPGTQWYNRRMELHRLDGPAIENFTGVRYWYIDGKMLKTDQVAAWYNQYKLDVSEPIPEEYIMIFKMTFSGE